MSERKLLLEVWKDFNDEGEPLPALLYAGSLGDESRRALGSRAQLVTKIWAASHYEAMTVYYRLMGWGDYTTNESWDYQPYPEEWLLQQQSEGSGVSHPLDQH